MKKVLIHTEYIELQNVLKKNGIIQTGGEAKFFLQNNSVLVNGELENRRGKKLYPGDQVEILNEVYKVTDQADRNLALRYDLTVPFAKYIAINQNTKLPFKRYEIGEVFRNGPVKLGRDREFIQCDVDSVGIEGQLVEAEFVALYVEAYNNLGIDVVIKYNNRK